MSVQLENIYRLEVHPSNAPLQGGTFMLPNSDYLQAERHTISDGYSLQWPTDVGAIEAIETALDTFGRDVFIAGSAAEGEVGNDDTAYDEGDAADVIAYVRDTSYLNKLRFVKLASPQVTIIWSAPAKRIVDSELYKAELSLGATGVRRDEVNEYLSHTALTGIAAEYPKAMRLLSSAVPVLRKA